MKTFEVSNERRQKIAEFNKLCKLNRLMESAHTDTVKENTVMMINNSLVMLPTNVAKKLL